MYEYPRTRPWKRKQRLHFVLHVQQPEGSFFFLNKKGVYVYQPAMFLGLVLEGTHKTRNATSCFERVFSFCAVAVWLVEPPCCKEGQDIKYSWLNALLSTKKQDIVSFLT